MKKVNWGPEPVDINDVRINAKPISFEQSYNSNDRDWIRELSFKVRNATNKNISYMRFELQFPLKDTPKRTFYVEGLEYGESRMLGSSGKILTPGQTIELGVNVDVKALKEIVQQKGQGEYLKINVAQLSTEVIDFEDHTSWLTGEWLRFDSRTAKWIGLTQPINRSGTGTFEFVRYKSPPGASCYRAAHDTIDCQAECQCGTSHSVSVPGDIVSSGSSSADKFQFCCKQNGVQCLVAYTGVTSGCQ
ncbi:MAG TPA: hypothetical protein VF088_12900 [Pyrinomonadaceae bacterium]